MTDNVVYEVLSEHPGFSSMKIRSDDKVVFAVIFKVEKMKKEMLQELRNFIKEHYTTPCSILLDISNVNSSSADALEETARMIKDLGSGNSAVKRVGICSGKYAKLALKGIFAVSKPKALTKVFDNEQNALQFVLEKDTKVKK
jgi:hypothetical protein